MYIVLENNRIQLESISVNCRALTSVANVISTEDNRNATGTTVRTSNEGMLRMIQVSLPHTTADSIKISHGKISTHIKNIQLGGLYAN